MGHTVLMNGKVGARVNSTRWSCRVDWQIAFLGSNETPSARLLQAYRDVGGRYQSTVIVGPPQSNRPRVAEVARQLAGAEIRRFIDSRRCTDASQSADGLHYSGVAARRWVSCILPGVLRHVGALPPP